MVVETTETDQAIQKVEVMEELQEQVEVEVVTEQQQEQEEQEERMIVSKTPDRISFHLLISILASYCNSYLGRNIFHLINAFK